jgi:hypothetical protein
MVGWLLVGVGGLVLAPLALINRAWWLLALAALFLLVGLVLLQARLQIVFDHRIAHVGVTKSWLGLRLMRHRYPLSDVQGVDIHRVAGDKRERPSDTWYLRLILRTETYTIGKYDTRLDALKARRDLTEVLKTRARPHKAMGMEAAAGDGLHSLPQSGAGLYQNGLAMLRSGDVVGARQAFESALALAQEPLLRRMIGQRLRELDRR